MSVNVQRLQYLGYRVRTVEDVKMDAGNAVGPKVFHLADSMLDADGPHRTIVVLVTVQFIVQTGWYCGPAKCGEPANLRSAQDRQHARDDRQVDAGFSRPIPQVVKWVLS